MIVGPDERDLKSLLTGQHQPIFSSTHAPPVDVFSATAVPAAAELMQFPPPIDPNPPPPPPPRPEHERVSPEVSLTKRLEEARDVVHRLSGRVDAHDRRHRAKAASESAIIDRCFHEPLTFRLKAAVLAGNADAVSTDGLLDPGRFARRREQQAHFEARIAAELGMPARPRARPRPLLDWKLFAVVRQTRFFDGGEPGHYGRRVLHPTFDGGGREARAAIGGGWPDRESGAVGA
jgi:hypothetical protein